MTQLDPAERTRLSETAVRSYELGTRNPKDAHREAIAEALSVSADYLREHDGRRKRGIVPLPHGDGGRGVPEARPDRRYGLRDAGTGEPRGRHPGVGREGTRLALREDRRGGVPPLAQRRIASGGANSHSDWDNAKMGPERMEEELAKLPNESDRTATGKAWADR